MLTVHFGLQKFMKKLMVLYKMFLKHWVVAQSWLVPFAIKEEPQLVSFYPRGYASRAGLTIKILLLQKQFSKFTNKNVPKQKFTLEMVPKWILRQFIKCKQTADCNSCKQTAVCNYFFFSRNFVKELLSQFTEENVPKYKFTLEMVCKYKFRHENLWNVNKQLDCKETVCLGAIFNNYSNIFNCFWRRW